MAGCCGLSLDVDDSGGVVAMSVNNDEADDGEVEDNNANGDKGDDDNEDLKP